MELIIPAIALGGLYFTNRQITEKTKENMQNNNLPEKTPAELEYEEAIEEVEKNVAENRVQSYIENVLKPNQRTGIEMGAPIHLPNGAWTDKFFEADNNTDAPFTHNNMAPFLRKNEIDVRPVQQNLELERRNGYGSSLIPRKKEQYAIYGPHKDVTFVHGTPNFTDYLRQRTYVSKNMDGVSAIEPQRQAPGANPNDPLAIGFNNSLGVSNSTYYGR